MSKVSIVGAGTAGVLSTAHFLAQTNEEIEWIYDPNTPAVPVGEGSLFNFNEILSKIGFTYSDLDNVNGTSKLGIYKENWGSNKREFYENFHFGVTASHFSANELQAYVLDLLKDKVSIVEKNVSEYSEIDADYIIDCRGWPKDYKDYHISEAVTVNTAYVTQCFWDYPKFLHTLTIARPWGWVFGIPLKHRCAIGYLFNSEISNIEIIKEDVKEVFNKFGLIPSNKTLTLPFKSYYKKQTYVNNVCYNGNTNFFLEPLEATSIHHMENILRGAYDVAYGNITQEQGNTNIINKIKEIENIISLHYLNGSIYDTDFWRIAKEKAEKNISDAMANPKFVNFIKKGLEYKPGSKWNVEEDYGSWAIHILHQNLNGLDWKDNIKKLLM